jgi:FXSXX-COOH protein
VETELVDVGGMPLDELRTSRDAAVVRSLRHVVARSAHEGVTEVNCAGSKD